MAIKHFNFSFKLPNGMMQLQLDVKDLLEYITERNTAVEIQVFGTEPKKPKVPQLEAPTTLALPAPTKRQEGKRKGGAQATLLIFFAMHQGKVVSTSMLRDMLVQQGYSAHTINNAIWSMKTNGLVRPVKGTKGQYRVTPKGIRTAEEMQING